MELPGDQACFPADIRSMASALGARDLTVEKVGGTHFGGPLAKGETAGSSLAGEVIGAWLRERFPAGQVSAR